MIKEQKEFSKRLIIEEIKQFCDLYRKNEGIGEQGLDELADIILNFSKNYISKDKIREEIKELEDNMILFTNDKEKFNRYKYARDILEKTLGE